MTQGIFPRRIIPVVCLLMIGATCLNGGCKFFRAPGKDKCEKIVSRTIMTDILTDVVLLEGWLGEKDMLSPLQNDSIVYYYAGLFRKYQITYLQFMDALYCYMLHDSEMQAIHDDILVRLSILESTTRISELPMVTPESIGKPLVLVDTDEPDDPFGYLKLRDWWRYARPDQLPDQQQLQEEFFQ